MLSHRTGRSKAEPLATEAATGERLVKLTPGEGVRVWLWTVRTLADGQWKTEIVPGAVRSHRLPVQTPEHVVVTAIGRTGLESAAVDLRPR